MKNDDWMLGPSTWQLTACRRFGSAAVAIALLATMTVLALFDVRLYTTVGISLSTVIATWLVRHRRSQPGLPSWPIRNILRTAIGVLVITELALAAVAWLATWGPPGCGACDTPGTPFATYRITVTPLRAEGRQFALHFDLTYWTDEDGLDASRPAQLPDRMVTAGIGPGLATQSLFLPGARSQPLAVVYPKHGATIKEPVCSAICPATIVTLISFPADLSATKYALGPVAPLWGSAVAFDSVSQRIDANGADISLLYVPRGPLGSLLRQPPANELIGVTSVPNGVLLMVGVLLASSVGGLPPALLGFLLGRISKRSATRADSSNLTTTPERCPAPYGAVRLAEARALLASMPTAPISRTSDVVVVSGKGRRGVEQFCSALRRHRLDANLTQEALAARSGISAQAISLLERGARQSPRRDTVVRLGRALRLGSTQMELFVAAGEVGRPTSDSAEQLEINSLPERGPLPAGSRMPLAPNPLFVGRGDEMVKIAAGLKGSDTPLGLGQLVVATGPRGLGKTHLAIEFVHRYGRFFAGGVFWLSFASADEITLQVAACAGSGAMDLEADAGNQPLEERVTLVMHAWQGEPPRLLVFDGCEEESLLGAWRPTRGGSRVLVTSRRSHWSSAMGLTALPLDVLPRADSVELLRHYRPDLAADDPKLDTIAARLRDLPSALHLAGQHLADCHGEVMVECVAEVELDERR